MYEREGAPFTNDAYAAVLVAEPALAADAEAAIALSGGRLVTRIGWDRVAEEIGRHAVRPVLVLETEGVAPALLEAALPRIDAVATALDLPIVAAFGVDDIDLVAATLLGEQVHLLCAPGLPDRVGTLALAGRLGAETALHGRVREGDAERLRRLNEEVARIAEVLVRLTARDWAGDAEDRGIADRRGRYGAEPPGDAEAVDAATIRQLIRSRRLRDGFFAPGLFEDPAWDMLLDLFAAELEGVRVSVSSLCIAAAVAPTTALRWIAKMTETGLFERQPDPFDRRRAYMGLTSKASDGLRGYVDAARRAGLPLA